MLAYLARRFYIAVLTLLGVSVIAFFLMRIIPGDAIDAQLGMHYTEARAEALRQEFGLDQPVLAQYGHWLTAALRGDLGQSIRLRRDVGPVLIEHLPVTLELAGLALGLAVIIGVPLGVLAAVRRGKVTDYLCGSFGVLGVSIPHFWLATLLILLFSLTLNILPAGGELPSLLTDPIGNLKRMIMPALALGAAVAAIVMRMTRSSVIEVLSEDYVRTAKAKGLSPRRVIVKHALRNALVPVLTILGVQAGYLLAGSVVVEMIFSLPGIGWLAFESATNDDYILLQAVILLIAVSFIAINLTVDLLYGVLDPRMRR
ncbi:MAG: ABC transporter permease [Phycisphaeraceae bacterium]